jgi:small subunit ribosomal protein S4
MQGEYTVARYTDPVCRLCRAEGIKLFLKGDRCNSNKCAIVRRAYRPGQHGQARVKMSEYGLRLREKQKVRRVYGVSEKQFRMYYEKAAHARGVTGEVLLATLERRLDNVVYRLGLAASRPQARQFVRHGFFEVDGTRTDIPSYIVKPGQVLKVVEKKTNFFKARLEGVTAPRVPAWLTFEADKLTGNIGRLPAREEIDTPANEQYIVEYYSR